MTGGQAVVRSLKTEKVEHMFGLIGSSTIEVFDALYGEKKIKFIGVRDEKTGTHMADGYARASGQPGIMLAGQNGPGATNLVTGIAQAAAAFSPLVSIAGAISTSDLIQDAFQGMHYCVMPSKSSRQESVKIVVGMIETIGSKPYFLDPQELDSFSAAVDTLPLIMATAYMNTISESVSWKEMHKSAGHLFDRQSVLASEDPLDSESASLTISDPLIHWIDQLMVSLGKMRTDILSNNDDLLDDFIRAWEERARWEIGAVGKEKSDIDIPSSASTRLYVRLVSSGSSTSNS